MKSDLERARLMVSSVVFQCLLLSLLITVTTAAPVQRTCTFPAIYNFGDSNSDTGGISAAFEPIRAPYGQGFFHKPAGRDSDGRLTIDFIAERVGLPYLSAYLNSLGSNFRHGANFATGGSTIRRQNETIFQYGISPFSLDMQITQFYQFKARSAELFTQTKIRSERERLPRQEEFAKALYTFDIGQNDLSVGFRTMSADQLKATIPNIVSHLASVVRNIYQQGGRTFWIHNTGPFGCLPVNMFYMGTPAPGYLDKSGCVKAQNEMTAVCGALGAMLALCLWAICGVRRSVVVVPEECPVKTVSDAIEEEEEMALSRNKRRSKRAVKHNHHHNESDAFVDGASIMNHQYGSASSDDFRIEPEQEEMALSLMMMSRDSNFKKGHNMVVNSLAESSDNYSVIIETKSSSGEQLKTVEEFCMKEDDGDVLYESDNSDSGYFRNGPKKSDSHVSVDAGFNNKIAMGFNSYTTKQDKNMHRFKKEWSGSKSGRSSTKYDLRKSKEASLVTVERKSSMISLNLYMTVVISKAWRLILVQTQSRFIVKPQWLRNQVVVVARRKAKVMSVLFASGCLNEDKL